MSDSLQTHSKFLSPWSATVVGIPTVRFTPLGKALQGAPVKMQMCYSQDVTHRFISIAYTLERHKKEAEWSSKMTKTLEFHLRTSLGFPCG